MKLSEEIENELTLPHSWGWGDSSRWVLPKVEKLEKENEKLQKQIKKMRNCYNCKNIKNCGYQNFDTIVDDCEWELK